MKVNTLQGYAAAAGLRSPWSVPSPQFIGPQWFTIDASLANGSATNVNLLERGRWFGIPEVRNGYGIPNSSATDQLKAFLQVEAYRLTLADSVLDIDTDTLQKLYATATMPYIDGTCAGSPLKWSLRNHIRQLFEQFQVTQGVAAAGEFGTLRGRHKVLPSPFVLDLFNDQLTLKSDADVALGAAIAVTVDLYGVLVPPNGSDAEPVNPTIGACKDDIPDDGQGGNAYARRLRQLGYARGQNSGVVASDLQLY